MSSAPKEPLAKTLPSKSTNRQIRFLIYGQLAWICLTGMFTGGWISAHDWPADVVLGLDDLFSVFVIFMFCGCPVLLLVMVLGSRYPAWRILGVFVVQGGLSLLHFVTLYPAVS